ncbi:ATP-binding protein [candidate division KSB1 bacterium]|nr:ATP-binding protein [candidate division KSB1 bacterium]
MSTLKKVVISSKCENIQRVEREAEKWGKALKLSQDELDSLAIAVTEVVANAIFHGNKEDQDKNVTVTFSIAGDELTVRITDEGYGFDVKGIRDPLDPANLLKESGRGIFLVRNLVDEVDFKPSKKGTTVSLKIRRKSKTQK